MKNSQKIAENMMANSRKSEKKKKQNKMNKYIFFGGEGTNSLKINYKNKNLNISIHS